MEMKLKIETFETFTLTSVEKPNRELSERPDSKINRNAAKHSKCNFLSPSSMCSLSYLSTQNKTKSHEEDEVRSDGEVIGLRNVENNLLLVVMKLTTTRFLTGTASPRPPRRRRGRRWRRRLEPQT